MVDKSDNQERINLMLVQESLWKVEDKVNVFLESIADHEAELIRLKRSVNWMKRRLEVLENNNQKNKPLEAGNA